MLALCCTIPAWAQNNEILRGDVNYDGQVTPTDISSLIDYLLNGVWGDEPVTESQTFTVNGVSFTMVPVEGGTFMMGATAEQGSAIHSDEKPTHEVTLSDFYIGETEVTQALWLAVMGSNPSDFTGDLKRPVERVSWDDCQEFIAQLNALTGETFRLPTEAQWEFAARGGNKSQGYKYAGSNDIDAVAWYSGNNGYVTLRVGVLSPNELGLYDMSGNVCEWCNDWYDDYSDAAQTDPAGRAEGYRRVYRGGCWSGSAVCCRVSYRSSSLPAERDGAIGLRLAL